MLQVGMFITHHWMWHVRIVRPSTLQSILCRDLFDIFGHHSSCKRLALRMANQMLATVKKAKEKAIAEENEKHSKCVLFVSFFGTGRANLAALLNIQSLRILYLWPVQ